MSPETEARTLPVVQGVAAASPVLPVLLPAGPAESPGAPRRSCGAKRGGCGSGREVLDPRIRERIHNHPCYSQEAHQHYARMHVAVAPACNIQCNYCNRKYDCANESRPGVTSRVLTPEEALRKVKYVASRVKELSVLGIAGPGDPLANPDRTFRTFELVARECPDIKLCLSTNGLRLLDHVNRIKALGIDHVTVTINMTEPEVGERIYPWIFYNHKRYTGREAARILSERQLAGLQALTENGILCKVNSVMIPGINDEHLVEVSRTVKRLGAFLHNIMPLISSPEHGTHFGLTGQRGPTPQELKALQDRCEAEGIAMNMMRHCRQCRADAVGLLGEDRGAEFAEDVFLSQDVDYDLEGRRAAHAAIERWREEVRTARTRLGIETEGGPGRDGTVLVAVASRGGGVVNQHFGHAREFWIYEAGPGLARFVQARSVERYCGGPETCNDDGTILAGTVRLLSDCAAVLCSRIGHEPRRALEAAGIECVEVYDLIETAVAGVGARLVGRRARTTR